MHIAWGHHLWQYNCAQPNPSPPFIRLSVEDLWNGVFRCQFNLHPDIPGQAIRFAVPSRWCCCLSFRSVFQSPIYIQCSYNLTCLSVFSFEHDKREMPVLWHQSLLTFLQRYKNDISSEQKEALFALLRRQQHPKLTPEIRRELQAARPRDVEMIEPNEGPAPMAGPIDGLDSDDEMDEEMEWWVKYRINFIKRYKKRWKLFCRNHFFLSVLSTGVLAILQTIWIFNYYVILYM